MVRTTLFGHPLVLRVYDSRSEKRTTPLFHAFYPPYIRNNRAKVSHCAAAFEWNLRPPRLPPRPPSALSPPTGHPSASVNNNYQYYRQSPNSRLPRGINSRTASGNSFPETRLSGSTLSLGRDFRQMRFRSKRSQMTMGGAIPVLFLLLPLRTICLAGPVDLGKHTTSDVYRGNWWFRVPTSYWQRNSLKMSGCHPNF